MKTIALIVLLFSCMMQVRAAEMFPFPVQTLNANHDATDMFWLNECPAGKNGPIRVKAGHFADGNGKRIRFLGVNLCNSGAFPDHAVAEKLAARLANLGVNCVRLHHMDGVSAPNGIWNPAYKDRQHMDAGQLDKLDYLIYQLKQHGVYADINLHVSRKFGPADGFQDADKLPKYDKGLDNFESRMIQLQKEYAKTLLTHLNPYTKMRYVDEPSVAMIEINNENSLVDACMDGSLAEIPDYYLSQIRGKWNEWLKARYSTTEKLRHAWQSESEPLGRNILANSELSAGTDHWAVEAPKPAVAVMEIADGPTPGTKALHARLIQPGKEVWHFQVHQTGLDMEEGKQYTIRFEARADHDREIDVYTGMDIAPWGRVGLSRRVRLSSAWRKYEFTFYANGTVKQHTRISFNLQSVVGDVWIAGMEMRRGGGGLADGARIETNGVDLPFFAYTPPQRADFLEFAAKVERDYAQGMRDYIKKTLGAKAQVVDTQTSYSGIAGLYRESFMDYGDAHAYWQHPSFPRAQWDPGDWTIRNTPMVKALGSDTLTRLAMCRIDGKPFTVSEYNHPSPSDYSAECVPMLAAFAAQQDWDGIFLFDYHSGGDWERDYISGYFQCDSNPSKIVFLPFAAAAFRRADVSRSEATASLNIPVSSIPAMLTQYGAGVTGIWGEAGLKPEEAVGLRTGVHFAKTGKSPTLQRSSSATTPSVQWKSSPDRSVFLVDSPSSRGVVGFAGTEPVVLGGMTLTMNGSNKFAVVTVTALDGKPLETSGHFLVCAAGRVENTGMEWNEERTSVGRNWGTGPVLAEGVGATLVLRCGGAGAEAWALDGGGGRATPVLCAVIDGKLTLEIISIHRTLWYEVVVK